MSRNDLHERILATLHDAVFDEGKWVAASALIDEACRTEGNVLVFCHEAAQEDIQIFFSRFCHRGEHRADWEREYYRDYYPTDEHLPRLGQLPDGRIVHVADLFSELELKRSRTYNEAMARMKHQNGVSVRLDGPHGSRIVLSMGDPVDAGGWSSARIDVVARLLPHIRQFMRVRHALLESRVLASTLTGLLDSTGAGVIHLDRRGQVVATNHLAQDLLQRGDTLSDQDGVLCTPLPESSKSLQRILRRALPPFGARGESGTMALRGTGGTIAPMLHVVPVQDRESGGRTWRVAAIVFVVDPGRRMRVERRLAALSLGLTQAESEVAVGLAEGRSVREIAAVTGRAQSTVRGHIKRMFTKLGLSRQTNLVQLVTALAAFPGRRQ